MLLANRPPTRDDRRHGALLHGDDGSVITGLDALHLSGLQRVPAPHGPVHVLIPLERRRTSHGLALVERTTRLPETASGPVATRAGRARRGGLLPAAHGP